MTSNEREIAKMYVLFCAAPIRVDGRTIHGVDAAASYATMCHDDLEERVAALYVADVQIVQDVDAEPLSGTMAPPARRVA